MGCSIERPFLFRYLFFVLSDHRSGKKYLFLCRQQSCTPNEIFGWAECSAEQPFHEKVFFFFAHSYMSGSRSFFAVCLLGFLLLPRLHGQPPFSVRGGASVFAEQCYRLTSEDSLHQASAIWSTVPIDFDDRFDLRFLLYFGCEKKGGEGMAFVLQASPDSTDFLGCPDNALGYGPSLFYPCTMPAPSLCLEIDTRFDGPGRSGELSSDHLALCRNGNFLSPILPPTPLFTPGGSLRDCGYHTFRIAWKPSENILRVWFDDELKITYPTDLKNDFFQGGSRAWFGFTASTGERPSTQMMCVRSITLEIDQESRDHKRFQNGVLVLPMPDEDRIGLDFDFEQMQNLTISVFSMKGEKVRTEKISGVTKRRHQLATQGLPSGIYYVSVTNGRQRVSKKILYIAQPKA